MTLEDLGYNDELEQYCKKLNYDSYEIGRIISEHKERYVVKTTEGDFDAEIIGNLRFSAQNRSDFPAVGDWVAVAKYDDNKMLIYAVYPRKTIISRKAVGKTGDEQIIATNIDVAFIVQAMDQDFNINRIERYLAICNSAKVSPVIILNKADLLSDTEIEKLKAELNSRIKNVPVVVFSNESKLGFEQLNKQIKKGFTYCLLGSSGVGKSTLLNNLLDEQLMKTNAISSSTGKGRHVTSHRELVVLKNGGIMIDNPGMREVGLADSSGGIELTFSQISELAKNCRFKDCTHTGEPGCAVSEAIAQGELDEASFQNYLKMEREKIHYQMTVAEKRQKEKGFGKMIKQVVKTKNLNNQ